MCIGKSRNINNDCYEIYRSCTKLNTIVVGGVSKLLDYFIKTYNIDYIMTKLDRRWTNDQNCYSQLNFDFLFDIEPEYYYVKSSNLYNKNKFNEDYLLNKLDTFDENISERENMYNNNYRVIWDCGSKVYGKKYE